jgi:hypothetical protein
MYFGFVPGDIEAGCATYEVTLAYSNVKENHKEMKVEQTTRHTKLLL